MLRPMNETRSRSRAAILPQLLSKAPVARYLSLPLILGLILVLPFANLSCQPLFFQHHVVAVVAELDAGHERPHQEHAAAAGTAEPGGGRRIGKAVGVEAGPLVGDLDVDLLRRNPAGEPHVLASFEALPWTMALTSAS